MHNDCNDGMNKYIDTCVCNLVISKSETEKKKQIAYYLMVINISIQNELVVRKRF